MKNICKFLLLASVIQPAVAADNNSTEAADKNEVAGFGMGALIGGLIAGPPGIAVGAIGGALYGHHTGRKDDRLTSLEKQLHDRQIDLALLQEQLTQTQADYAGNLRKIAAEYRKDSLEKLADGVSFSIYFRTNESYIEPGLAPHIRDLVSLIRDVPDVKVLLEAYADERGLPSYNLQLSHARAKNVQSELIKAGFPANRIIQHAYGESRTHAVHGDVEGYVFDRRVDIRLTLDSEA